MADQGIFANNDTMYTLFQALVPYARYLKVQSRLKTNIFRGKVKKIQNYNK